MQSTKWPLDFSKIFPRNTLRGCSAKATRLLRHGAPVILSDPRALRLFVIQIRRQSLLARIQNGPDTWIRSRSEEHTSELQSPDHHSFPTRRSSDLQSTKWPLDFSKIFPRNTLRGCSAKATRLLRHGAPVILSDPRALRLFVIQIRRQSLLARIQNGPDTWIRS